MTLVGESHRKTHVKRCKDAQLRRVEEGYLSGQTGYGWRWAPVVQTNGRHRREIEPVPEQGRRNEELTIDLKLCLLPEQRITLQIQKKPRKVKPRGVAGLTERQLALLKHVEDGMTLREIAEIIKSPSTPLVPRAPRYGGTWEHTIFAKRPPWQEAG